MKHYIITEESKAEAKRVYGRAIVEKFTTTWAFCEALNALCVLEDAKGEDKPKPVGPGTRLRAANGDELVIVKSPTGYTIINLRSFRTEETTRDPEALAKYYLFQLGAMVIE